MLDLYGNFDMHPFRQCHHGHEVAPGFVVFPTLDLLYKAKP